MNSLRITPTNSGDDSDGMVWGIAGNLLWLVLIALSLSAILMLFTALVWRWPLTIAAALSAAPTVVTIAYCHLKQAHHPGWDRDVLHLWLYGRAFGPLPAKPEE